MTPRSILRISIMLFDLALIAPAWAHAQATPDSSGAFVRTSARITMRDGVVLNTDIYTPKNRTGELPILMTRTPYGIDGAARNFDGPYKELAADGYIFVFQDIRGRFKSEGQFVMQRPPKTGSDAKAIDEASDAFDTIDWLIKNVPGNNGRVGMLGVSYDGWL
ncbi:MAG: CocE/NonD family hydrolase, partial [Gemmatimonadota bacterium]